LTAYQINRKAAMTGIFRTTASQNTAQKPLTPGSYPGSAAPNRCDRAPGATGALGYIAAVADPGLFGPGSITWRINREGVLLVGGGRALVLQVAHPLVAAGVTQHSNYREDPWGRLYRTLDLTTKIVFGDTGTADQAADRIRRVHTRVRGKTTESAGRFPAGTPYDANDPDNLMWVHATLVDTALLVYDRYVARLQAAEREAYYQEQKLLGEQFGVPRELQPKTYGDFNEYFDAMVATLSPELPFVARPLVEALNLATVGMLPQRLRGELGLAWGPNRERLLAASRTVFRGALRLLPGLLREFPPARSADRRLHAAA
jgi:uncharacterized protein (DUF2236 family)